MVRIGSESDSIVQVSTCPEQACKIVPPYQIRGLIQHSMNQAEKYQLKQIDARTHHELLQTQLKVIKKEIKKSDSNEVYLNPRQIEILKSIVSGVIDFIKSLNEKSVDKEKPISEKRAMIGETRVEEIDLKNLPAVEIKNLVEAQLEETSKRIEQVQTKREAVIARIYNAEKQLEVDASHTHTSASESELQRKRSHRRLHSNTPAPSNEEFLLSDRVTDVVQKVAEEFEKVMDEIKSGIDKVFNSKQESPTTTEDPSTVGPEIPAAVYDAKNRSRLPGTLVFDNAVQTDNQAEALGEAVDNAYQNTQKVLKFWKETFNIDFGRRADSVIHYLRDYVNAFYDGSQMVYGDGDKYFDAFYRYLNIAGHEIGHALVGEKLNYYAESGALNESFADVLAACTDMFTDKTSVEEYHFLVGKDLVRYKGEKYPLRTFKEGPAYSDVDVLGGTDPQPDTMPDRSWYLRNAELLAQDQGGVHILSKIPNRVFYMVTQAQKEWEAPMLFWKRVLDQIKDPNMNFADFAALQISMANEEENQTLVAQLNQAWATVGVKPNFIQKPFEKEVNELEEKLALV